MSAAPKRMTTGPRPGRGWREALRFIGPTLLLACTLVFGFTYFLLVYLPAEKRQAVEAWSARLSAMAEDRSAVVTHWVAEKVRDGAALARNPEVGALLKESGGTAGAGGRRRQLLGWFSRAEGYLAAYVLDASGAVVAQTSGSPPIEASCVALAGRVLTHGPVAAAFHVLPDGTPAVAFAVPIPPLADGNERPSGESPGVVVLEADPSHWLYPFLVSEPIPSSSGEVLLARMEADEIVFLSPLRHRPARPPTFRVPAMKSLAARAVLEGRQVFQDVLDYRGVPVFAVGRPIAATSWWLVAKVDQHEALAGFHDEVRNNALLLAGAALVIAGAMLGLWRARRARLETAVTQSEQRFALLRDHANDAVVFTRKDGRLYDVNRAAEVLYGYPREELIGLDMRKVLPEAARVVSIPRMDLGGDDKGVVFEVVHVRRDGTPFPVEVSSHPVHVDGEEMFLSIIRDISARKRAEEDLRKSNEIIKGILNAIPARVFWKDKNLVYLGCNAVFAHDAGFADPQDLIGKDDYQMGWHDQAELYRANDRQVIESGCSRVLKEEPQTTPEGGTVTLLTSKVPLLDSNGEISGLLGTYMDITERKRTEEALRESEARYRALVLSANDAIVTADDAGFIVGWNLGAERMFGYAEAEVTGQSLTVLMPDRYRERHRDGMKRVVGGGRSSVVGTTVELDGVRKDGTEFPLELSLSQCEVNGACLFTSIIRDITERKRAEETLRESEARYRALIDGSADGIAIAEIGTKTFKYVNPALCRMLGYSADEMRTMGVSDIHPKDAVQRVVAEFEAQARGDKTLATDIPCLRKDGAVVFVDINTAKITIDDRPCNVGFFRNITERKRAEGALRESEERFRILFEQAADCIFLLEIGPEGIPVIRDANRATFRLLGYERDELIGQPVSFTDAAPDASKVVAERRRNVLSGTGALFEVRHRCKDGTILDFECSVTELQIGSKTLAVSVERDVSERKRAQEELGRLAAVVKQTAEAVVMTDMTGKIMYVNPAFTRVTGYAPEEVLGQNPRILKSGKQPKEYYRELWDTILAGNTWHGHFVNRRKDGSLYEEDAVISPVRDSAGGITYLVAVKRDVTQEIMLEAQLRQRQKLEAIGRLAGGVAHDFNNLLQAMLAGTQLLRSGAVEKQQVASAVADLEEQIWRGASLTRQLLQFSRQEAPRLERLDINEVVRNAAKLVRRLVRENIALEVRVADTPLVVEGDRGQLTQVVMDLAVNATDSMPTGGSLVIAVDSVDRDTVVLSVTDTGHGIPEEVRDHIFDPFFTTKGVGKGSGLGLAAAHGIVTQHGGRIELESRVGEGTTFRVFIPRLGSGEPGPISGEGKERSELPQGRGERILLVEDEEGARKGLRAILSLLGYDVVAEGSAEDAGKLPVYPPFDLLLSDVVLPGATGNELSRGLVDRWPGLKVILMSGYLEDDALREVIARGGVHFLRKPFDMAALAREVRTVLDEGTS